MNEDDMYDLFYKDYAIWLAKYYISALLGYYKHSDDLGFVGFLEGKWPDEPEKKFIHSIQLINDAKFNEEINILYDKYNQDTNNKYAICNDIMSKLEWYTEKVKCQINDIPSSIAKAQQNIKAFIDVGYYQTDQAYDALLLLSRLGHCVDKRIGEIIAEWRKSFQRYKNDFKDDPSMLAGQDLFWTSLDDMEESDAVSRYRFLEHFDIRSFEKSERGIENLLAGSLLYGTGGPQIPFEFGGDVELGPIAYNLWLVSRSPKLCTVLRPCVELALFRIANQQFEEGCWLDYRFRLTDGREKAEKDEETGVYELESIYSPIEKIFPPSIYRTSLCTYSLLKLSRKDWQYEIAKKAVSWLVKQQKPEGYWSKMDSSVLEAKAEAWNQPDLFTTLLSLDCIRMSGIGGLEHNIESGENWILRSQDPSGLWIDTSFPFPFDTVIVLEYFRRKPIVSERTCNFLSYAKSFLSRSQEFLLEDNEKSNGLAVITAYQGLESFLYACLETPRINIPILTKGNRSIGVREALNHFQEYLRNTGVLNRTESIHNKNKIDKLGYYRDEIVHKGFPISKSICTELLDGLCEFVKEYSIEVFGAPLLD